MSFFIITYSTDPLVGQYQSIHWQTIVWLLLDHKMFQYNRYPDCYFCGTLRGEAFISLSLTDIN